MKRKDPVSLFFKLSLMLFLPAMSCKNFRYEPGKHVHRITGRLFSSLTRQQPDTGFVYTTEEYDLSGRMLTRTFFNRQGDTTYSWIYDKQGRLASQNIPFARISFYYNSDTATWYYEGSITKTALGKSQCYCVHIPGDTLAWKNPVADVMKHVCSDGDRSDTLYFLYDANRRPLGFQPGAAHTENFLSVRYDYYGRPVLLASSGEAPVTHLTYTYDNKNQLKEALLLPLKNGEPDTSVIIKYKYEYYHK